MASRKLPIPFRLMSYARPYLGRVALVWLAIGGLTVFQLLGPWLVGYAIDVGLDVDDTTDIAQGSGRTLAIAAILILLASAARGFFQFFQTYNSEWLAQHAAYDIRNNIYDHLQRLSFAYHDKAQTGQIMQRATQDVEGVRMFISMGAIRLVYVLVLLVVTLTLMFRTDPQLAMLSLIFIPPTAFIAVYFTSQLRPIMLLTQQLQGELGVVLQENLSGMRVVKAFGREIFEQDKFGKQADALFANSYKSNQLQAKFSPMLTGIWSFAMVATAWYGAYRIEGGHLTAGELATFMLYLSMLQLPVRSIGWINMLWARARASGERIYDILDAESAVQEKPNAVELTGLKGHVRFDHVSFGYDAISPVLNDVSIDAPPGQVIALLGQTGSGKTTVVNLMPRFYDVSGGAITIDGTDIRDATLTSLRRAFGIVQQDVFLFSATIRDNIAYGSPHATDDDIAHAARLARIHEFISGLPDGYHTWIGERGVTLSGGQKQRISIARTLLLDPKILVFDDSTSSVDTRTEYEIQQALQELMKGRTTFVIAQRLRTVRAADQILVLKGGRIVEQGRHEELIERDGLYRQIYDLELRDQEEAFERERERVSALGIDPVEQEQEQEQEAAAAAGGGS